MPLGDRDPPPADDPLVGTVVSDRYRIVRKVGEGGMGAVYQAEHAVIGKRVALKVLFADLTRRNELCARFLQEAKSASRIIHENVIDISDFGQTPDGLVYIAMEFLEGQDLGRTLRADRTMAWPRAQPILMQIAKALQAAHAQGIIHRDMKPENIFLVQREGRPDFVKVLDFGIAKVVSSDESDGPRLTQTGVIFGTPEYMSPEQAQGHPPDHRVDVYAVGCIMYQMLTGAVPFHAESFMGILTKHLLEPVVPPRQRRPDLDIPPDVEAVCLRAMEKERDRRFPDMEAFYRALSAARGASAATSSAALKYPTLAQPSSDARESKTAITASPPVGAFDDERPARPAPPPGGLGTGAKLGLAGAVAAAILVSVLALRGGSPKTPPAAPPAQTSAATVAPPVAPSPPPAAEPAATPAAPAVAPETAAGEKPAHPHRRHADSEKVDPLHRRIEVPGESPATPAELKNPFATP